MKKKWLVALLWLQVIAVAAMIFWFSAQDGETSMETSGGIVDFLLHLLSAHLQSAPVGVGREKLPVEITITHIYTLLRTEQMMHLQCKTQR